MAAVATNKRSVISLYSDPLDAYSHQVRMVLAEKGVSVDVIPVSSVDKPEDLYELNPYGSLPTLVDRELVLYESRIILEYLDERFPHPPLMPVYPVMRAECRRMIYRIDRDWYSKMKIILNQNLGQGEIETARKQLQDNLTAISPVFSSKPFFLSDEFTLVDCWLAPLLWRASLLGLNLQNLGKPIQDYAQRIFQRDAFQISLSDAEKELRAA